MSHSAAKQEHAQAITLTEWAELDDEIEGELVDGVLEQEERPSFLHEIIVAWLIVTLHPWARPSRSRHPGVASESPAVPG